MDQEETSIYKIRDSVDVYTIQDEILYFYFINTRMSKQYRVSKETIVLIQLIDGESTVAELAKKYRHTLLRPISTESILQVLQFLEKENYVGLLRVEALKREIQAIDPAIQMETCPLQINPETDVSELIGKATFIVNTADEPYIGFTSLKISRECCRQRKPLFIAGGFDIHCMSTGELIIPGVTPCSDCYSNYFHKKLEGWTPLPKAVVDTHNEYGGFSAQSLFSASYACMEIIKFICNFTNAKIHFQTRGEMDMEDYSIHYIDIKKDPNCNICGGITYESQD